MELSKKVKVALDETRMLILGAQILLGFQFRGVFGDGYDLLPADSRYLSGVAMVLMICVVGLLITPGPYHRMVEAGTDSGRFHRLVTIVAELALLPFALALGLDLFITVERIFGETASAAAGTSSRSSRAAAAKRVVNVAGCGSRSRSAANRAADGSAAAGAAPTGRSSVRLASFPRPRRASRPPLAGRSLSQPTRRRSMRIPAR